MNVKISKPKAKSVAPYIFVMIVSAIIGIITFKAKNMAPFGDQAILQMDMWGQYFPMYFQKSESSGLQGMLWSWNGALGHNSWAESAYYTNSIFVWLFNWIPLDKMAAALDVFCLMKISISSATCLALLRYKTKSESPVLCGGAVAYSTCAYMLAYMLQFMWTDILMYFPIMLMGIEMLIKEKKPLLYSVSLAVIIISNFYIGFSACIFSALYFAVNSLSVLEFKRVEKKVAADEVEIRDGQEVDSLEKIEVTGWKNWGMTIARFGIFSIISGALSAMVTIPVWKAISKTIASGMSYADITKEYDNLFGVLQKFTTETGVFVAYEGANLWFGMIMFAALPLFFVNKKIPVWERLANGALFGILILSLNTKLLDYIWHGAHFPNQLPARWSFMVTLFAIILCCRGLTRLDGISPVRALIGSGIGLGTLCLIRSSVENGVTTKQLIITAIYAIIVIAASVAMQAIEKAQSEKKKFPEKKWRKIVSLGTASVIAGIMIIDSGMSFYNTAKHEGVFGLQTSGVTDYNNELRRSAALGEKWKSGDDDFYRIEGNPGFTFNPSMIGDYHGIGYYSSTMQGNVYEFLHKMGNRVYADRVSTVYSWGSPVQNSLLGVKYIFDFSRYAQLYLPGLTEVENNEMCSVMQTSNNLSLAYTVSNNVLSWEMSKDTRPASMQNSIVNAMCGRDLNPYRMIETDSFYIENATLMESENWDENYYLRTDQTQPVKFIYTYTIPYSGSYFMENNFRAGDIVVHLPDGDRPTSADNTSFVFIGDRIEGDTITIEVNTDGIDLGCCGLNCYYYDTKTWESAYKSLSSRQLDITKAGNAMIEGTISLPQECMLFSSIPQDGGWKVYCDGKEIETTTLLGVFVGAKIPAGDHTITYKYSVPGLATGCVITITGIVFIMLYIFRKKIFALGGKTQSSSTPEDKQE